MRARLATGRERHPERKRAARELYDLCAPEFLELWGPYQHDGYYERGDTARLQAQERLLGVIAERAELGRGTQVLDVGCGLGGTGVWLARERGCEVLGIDNSVVQVKLARELARRSGVSVRFAVMDAEDLALEATFDAVLLVGVLGHLADQGAFLERSRGLLVSGGRVVICDWMLDPGRTRARVADVLESMGMPAVYTAAQHTQTLERSGFAEVRVFDDTRRLARSWPLGARELARPALWRLIRKLGTRALAFVRGARALERAREAGDLHYCMIVARA